MTWPWRRAHERMDRVGALRALSRHLRGHPAPLRAHARGLARLVARVAVAPHAVHRRARAPALVGDGLRVRLVLPGGRGVDAVDVDAVAGLAGLVPCHDKQDVVL